MADTMINAGGGLSKSKLALATAATSNVLKDKTFYAGDKELKTGTGTLTPNTTSEYRSGAGAYSTTCHLHLTATKQSDGKVTVNADAWSADQQGYNPGEWHRYASITVEFK